MSLENLILEILHDKKSIPWLMPFLKGFSQVYRAGVYIRNKAYDLKLLNTSRLDKTVVSIGNVAACGTGKTPFTHLFSSLLSSRVSLAILTRGFKSQIEHSGLPKQVSVQEGSTAQEYGDEPLLLARKTSVPVWVGADRVKSGQLAIESGAQCLILDDGMQHRQLQRDIEIVMVDGKDPLCKERYLPYGFLRDSLSRLKKATVIVASHIEDRAHYERVQQLLAPFSAAPLVGVQVHVLSPPLRTHKVGVCCGIGRPERFLQTVRDLKQEIVDTLVCKDHEIPQEELLHRFSESCLQKGAEAILCTEKDAIKFSRPLSLSLPLIPIEIGLKVVEGECYLKELIETIVKKVKS